LTQPALLPALESLVAEQTAGSPVNETKRWTNCSPAELAAQLQADGFTISDDTVRRLLVEDLELSVRAARKEEASSRYPFRNEQFEHIARRRRWYERCQWPILSIDTKKKELLGNFYRPGRAYTDGCVRVLDHDFATLGVGRLVPYGVYDVQQDEGFLQLSLGPDTSELACDAIWRWWQTMGKVEWNRAEALLLLCDCGGSNGNRLYRFKEDLKRLAMRLDRRIEVAHYPPSCSKYNPIEHRLFCHVTRAMRGVVLKTIDVARRFMAHAHTRTGLRVIVETTEKLYEKGRKATDRFLEASPILYSKFLPDLNYSFTPQTYG
jgi:hypothetical protein